MEINLPLIYICLVNYNGYEDTIECIESLKNITYENYKIIIVDNASTDNSYEILKKLYNNYGIASGCDIIANDNNGGFSVANNIAIRHAIKNGAEYVLLLNNDTVVKPELLDELLKSFQRNKDAGIVGGKIYHYDNSSLIDHAGGDIDLVKYTTSHYGLNQLDNENYNFEKEVGFISGCLMLIKREVFEKVGFLPEEYFMYYEDTDFCLKAKEKGYKLIYNPKGVIYHKGAKSSGGSESVFYVEWSTRNRIIFMNKYKTKGVLFIYSNIYFYFTRFVRLLQYTCKGDIKKSCALMKGIREGIKYIRNI